MRLVWLKIFVYLFHFFTIGTYAQNPINSKVIVGIDILYAGIDNPLKIWTTDTLSLSVEQISASVFISYNEQIPLGIKNEYGYFTVNPDTVGIAEIKIKLSDTIEIKKIRVKPLAAVGRLGRYKANSDEKIGIGEFKAQLGIIANIECCDINARCKIYGFQIMRISAQNEVERATNLGALFEENTREIIKNAEKGDLFIFRNIRYRCPGTSIMQRLEDMTFELE